MRRRNHGSLTIESGPDLDEDARNRVALLIRGLEMPRPDHAVMIDDERAREGYAECRVSFRDGRIENAVPLDHRRSGIGQQRKRNAAAPGKIGERRDWIVTDGHNCEPFAFQLLETSLQLDELRLAVRSPVGGSEEHEDRAFASD